MTPLHPDDLQIVKYEHEDLVHYKAYLPLTLVVRVSKREAIRHPDATKEAVENLRRKFWYRLFGGIMEGAWELFANMFRKTGPHMFVLDPEFRKLENYLQEHLCYPGAKPKESPKGLECPHCGAPSLLFRNTPHESFAVCYRCQARGPVCKTEDEARENFLAHQREQFYTEGWEALRNMQQVHEYDKSKTSDPS